MTYELLGQRDLVKLHLVDAGRGRAEQHAGCSKRTGLHIRIST